MNKSKIEWCDYTINPVKGKCPMACPYCYARRMYNRFKWNPELKFVSRWWTPLTDLHIKPSRIFVGSTMELFGDFIPEDWTESILNTTQDFPDHTFIFLTKQPQNLIKWSPFPDNCDVGVSVTANGDMTMALTHLANIKARVRFISFEPLLGQIGMNDHMTMKGIVDWVIIGQQTPVSKKTEPRVEWIREIMEAADKAGIPVFLKNNLYDLLLKQPHTDLFWADLSNLRQEFPLPQKEAFDKAHPEGAM